MVVTRSETVVYLIGEPSEMFQGTMLPTTKDVLSVYFCHQKREKLSQKESIMLTVKQVREIWAKAGIPTAEDRNITRKLELLVDKYRSICRNKTRGGAAQLARESNFQIDANQLFNNAHHAAMELIKIEEDRVFLSDQRTERKYVMGEVDKELAAVEDRRAARMQREAELRNREEERRKSVEASAAVSLILHPKKVNTALTVVKNAVAFKQLLHGTERKSIQKFLPRKQ